jgi:hypothetical protein
MAEVYYRGSRTPLGTCVIHRDEHRRALSNCRRTRVAEPYRHSPTGFEWGYAGSGPADTAWALLADVYDDETADELYQAFKFEIVAALPRNGWALSRHAIRRWVTQARRRAS